jgi:hypothetical protein
MIQDEPELWIIVSKYFEPSDFFNSLSQHETFEAQTKARAAF